VSDAEARRKALGRASADCHTATDFGDNQDCASQNR
jgi:hypothetical protein